MLRKLLPFLNRDKSQNQEKSLPNDQFDINRENLIATVEIPASVLIKAFLFPVVITLSFIVIALINQGFKTILTTRKIEQLNLINSLQKIEDKKNLILETDKKIKFYQSFLQSKKSLANNADFIIDHINPNLIVNSSEIKGNDFGISLTGKNIYLFTQLIMQYLEGNKVDQVSIISADYATGGEGFAVVLKGVLK